MLFEIFYVYINITSQLHPKEILKMMYLNFQMFIQNLKTLNMNVCYIIIIELLEININIYRPVDILPRRVGTVTSIIVHQY